MSVIFVLGDCIACQQPFTFNPMRVPSVTINGEREPVCRNCVERANVQREAKGLAPIVPLKGAYEPCEVLELEDES